MSYIIEQEHLTLNDVGFDKTPIIPVVGRENYQVDEAELQKSIEKNRQLLISHGYSYLYDIGKRTEK